MGKRRSRVRSVCVFCASSRKCGEHFHEAAAEMGTVLGERGYTIVYGGGRVGSMGCLADAGMAAGGEVVGIIPQFMMALEWQHPGLSDLIVVKDLRERKKQMIEAADAIVALPGGSGTLEELFEAITLKRLGMFLGPIVLVNTAGFYEPLVRQLDSCVDEVFMDRRHREMWQVVEEPADVIKAFRTAREWSEKARRFAAL